MKKNQIAVGTRVRLSTTHSDGSTVTWTSVCVRVWRDGSVWLEIPARVRALPFAPYDGKRYAQFAPGQLDSQIIPAV